MKGGEGVRRRWGLYDNTLIKIFELQKFKDTKYFRLTKQIDEKICKIYQKNTGFEECLWPLLQSI